MLKHLKTTEWHKLQMRIDGGMSNPIWESDFLAWAARGAMNTQLAVTELPTDKKDTFQNGVFYRLQSLQLETDMGVNNDTFKLTFAQRG